jgi:hypothetical protein
MTDKKLVAIIKDYISTQVFPVCSEKPFDEQMQYEAESLAGIIQGEYVLVPQEGKEKPKPCQAWVRADLLRQNLAVPVGDIHYSSADPLPYRWVDDETFQIRLLGNWHDAQSIDWDFSNESIDHVTTGDKP